MVDAVVVVLHAFFLLERIYSRFVDLFRMRVSLEAKRQRRLAVVRVSRDQVDESTFLSERNLEVLNSASVDVSIVAHRHHRLRRHDTVRSQHTMAVNVEVLSEENLTDGVGNRVGRVDNDNVE